MSADSVLRLLRTEAELAAARSELRHAGRSLVLVPTMGDLHDGHLSLARAGAELGPVLVSIFVNPTQFGPNEDFEAYPRDLESDLRKLRALGVAAAYAPAVDEVYRAGDHTFVEVESLSKPLCGTSRPGHFRGVCTVVAKLLLSVRPDIALFGAKDAQQCLIIDRMVRDLRLPVRLGFVPTVRDADGLALSSRNRYLDASERLRALSLSRALHRARGRLSEGERDVAKLESTLRSELQAAGVEIDYAEIRRVPDLAPLERAQGRLLMAVAARVGRARLIDNLCVDVLDSGVNDAPLSDDARPQRLAELIARERGNESQ